MLVDWTYAHFVRNMESEQRQEFDTALENVRNAEEIARQERLDRIAQVQAMQASSGT